MFYDLRVDNKCNLACISCQPKYSSLWAKELKVEILKTPITLDIESVKQAEKVYLAGGEPLLIPDFIELITTISKLDNQPELVINTNLTKVNTPLKKLLGKITNLTLTVSVDGYDKVNEYHRWPMKWKKFQDNLTWIRSNLDCTIQFNTVLDAVSIIGAGDLIEVEGLVDYWNLHIITGPQALLVNNLPEDQKLAITTRFQRIKQSRFYTTDPAFKTRVDSAIEQIKQPGDCSLLSNFILALDQRRKINHSTYLGVKLT
jgi:organic radical activating enzyme